MSARNTAPGVRRRLVAVVLDWIEGIGIPEAAAEIGRDASNLRRWRQDPQHYADQIMAALPVVMAWEADTGARELHQVIASAYGEGRPQGSAVTAYGGTLRIMQAGGELTALAAEAIQDGRVDINEAVALRAAIMKRRALEDAEYLPALEVIIGGQR